MDKYLNRQEAGEILARALTEYAERQDVLVLALPRGGVPVAYEIAKRLRAPMDVFVVRKLGVPGHSELAMGAISMGGIQVFNDDIISDLSIPKETIQSVIAEEKQELTRREIKYRGTQAFPSIKNKIVILVDDGIATGATMRAAILSLRQLNPLSIIVAVPVADKRMCEKFQSLADQVICPLQPLHFYAVGAWYEDFSQTEDSEVYELLHKTHVSSDKEC